MTSGVRGEVRQALELRQAGALGLGRALALRERRARVLGGQVEHPPPSPLEGTTRRTPLPSTLSSSSRSAGRPPSTISPGGVRRPAP